jgi:hypothetical protein
MLLQYRDPRNREYINMADAGGQGQGQSRIDIEGHGRTKFLGNIPPSTLSSLVVSLVQVREIPH